MGNSVILTPTAADTPLATAASGGIEAVCFLAGCWEGWGSL